MRELGIDETQLLRLRNNNMAIFHLKVGIYYRVQRLSLRNICLFQTSFYGGRKDTQNRPRLRNLLSFDLERECRHETRNCQNARDIIANKTAICYRRNTQLK